MFICAVKKRFCSNNFHNEMSCWILVLHTSQRCDWEQLWFFGPPCSTPSTSPHMGTTKISRTSKMHWINLINFDFMLPAPPHPCSWQMYVHFDSTRQELMFCLKSWQKWNVIYSQNSNSRWRWWRPRCKSVWAQGQEGIRVVVCKARRLEGHKGGKAQGLAPLHPFTLAPFAPKEPPGETTWYSLLYFYAEKLLLVKYGNSLLELKTNCGARRFYTGAQNLMVRRTPTPVPLL